MPSQIIGDDELIRKLQRITNLDFLRPHIQASVTHISGRVSAPGGYPEQRPPKNPDRWYERGWGTRYRRKDGTLGGQQTSEDLGMSWLGKVLSNTRGEIGNDASYGPYVQGEEQSSLMREIGWKTTDQIVEDESEFILKEIQKAVDRELAKG